MYWQKTKKRCVCCLDWMGSGGNPKKIFWGKLEVPRQFWRDRKKQDIEKIFLGFIFVFHIYVLSAYHVCTVPTEATRGCWFDPLGLELQTVISYHVATHHRVSEGAVSTLNSWTIVPAPRRTTAQWLLLMFMEILLRPRQIYPLNVSKSRVPLFFSWMKKLKQKASTGCQRSHCWSVHPNTSTYTIQLQRLSIWLLGKGPRT